MKSIHIIRDDQRDRATKFPKDRIPFYQSESSALKDVNTFNRYAAREITLKQAISEIEEHNYIEITERQFIKTFESLGYVLSPDDGGNI